MTRLSATLLLLAVSLAPIAHAEIEPAPDRELGEGPFDQLILRGGILVNGTGAPPIGPVDIVIENKRIVQIAVLGAPGVPVNDADRPALADNGREIDIAGQYVLPGFVDMHGHIGGQAQGTPMCPCMSTKPGSTYWPAMSI